MVCSPTPDHANVRVSNTSAISVFVLSHANSTIPLQLNDGIQLLSDVGARSGLGRLHIESHETPKPHSYSSYVEITA